ncbi:hypothetical protein DRH27_01550 [Candidatus Falkowbacteria bacterium]|nr:MAG: hypothetical protein DRH27_01550 [Candidatus Falkowbacteria bacterium]
MKNSYINKDTMRLKTGLKKLHRSFRENKIKQWFRPANIRAILTMPRNWLHIAGLAIFMLSVYFLIFHPLPQANNKIEVSHTESGSPASITITNKEFKIELQDIYSDIDEAVFSDPARANQYIEAISYKAKKKNINTVNNKKVALSNINTNIVYMDDSNLEFNKANLELKKQDNNKYINTILYCADNDFNKKTGECTNWQISDIKPENKDDYISFTTYHFSAYVGAYLEIIDVQSNLTKGDVWEVRFQTEGLDNLEIEAVDGTLFDIDIEFISVSCGETEIASENIEWQNQKLIIANYSCDNEISRIRNQTITGGRHWLSFSFGYTQGVLAHNFACDSGDLDTDCYVTTQQYLGDGDEISGSGNLIVQSGGDLTASSSATSGTTYGNSFGIDMGGDITIQSEGMITGNVMATATEIDVQVGGSIDVDEKGYQKQAGLGAGIYGGVSYCGTGAGHGGTGGKRPGRENGPIYGSTTYPTLLGSGGGNDEDGSGGGYGGGAIILSISGTTTINGIISANAGDGYAAQCGGGSGGSILIETNTLAGIGTTSAVGGKAYESCAAGGGGGRIAVYYTTDNSSLNYQVYGGYNAGSNTNYMGGGGTIYKKSSAQSHGDLIIDNSDRYYTGVYGEIYHGKTEIYDELIVDQLTISNRGFFNVVASTNLTYSSLDWSNEAIIVDNGGSFTLFATGTDIYIATTSILKANTERTWGDIEIDGVLTHSINSTNPDYLMNLTVSSVLINSIGEINVNSKGYQNQNGLGQGDYGGSGQCGSGAGHGATGGAGASRTNGAVYGSTTYPVLLGSGGGNDTSGAGGGYGGGAIKLSVCGTTTVNGLITANGGDGFFNQCGGGSGGSILLYTDVLAGIGTTSAIGGKGEELCTAGGAGGRIAVYCTTDNSSIIYQAYGGYNGGTNTDRMGGAGTIYKKSSSQDYGDLVIDNNGRDDEDDAYIGKTYINEAITVNTLTIQNEGHLDISNTTNITHTIFNWTDAGNITDNGGTLSPFSDSGSLTIATTSRLHGKVIRTFTDLTINGTMILYNYSTSSAGKLDISGDVIIGSSGKLTHYKNSTAQTHVINLEADNLTIDNGGMIDLSAKGYKGQSGPGAGVYGGSGYCGTGAGHGGTGGKRVSRASGPSYGSTTEPSQLGSGGGNDNDGSGGGYGGGAVKLSVSGTTTINGIISADAGDAFISQCGGGSGGSILLYTDVLVGIGTISVIGGNGKELCTGAGAAGRIAVYYTTDNSSIIYQAYGGYNGGTNTDKMGGAGTIYKKSLSQDHGDLIIDNSGRDNEDGVYVGKTVIIDTLPLNTLTIQNYGHLYASSMSNITYNTISWFDEAIIEDYGGLTTMFDGSQNIIIATTSRLYVNTARNCNSLIVNGKLSHWYNTTVEENKINITATNDITINSGATVSVNGKGYSGGYGDGAGSDQGGYGSGAGHGGKGGATADGGSSGGSTYDSTTTPVNIGSGGGDDGGVTGGPAGGGAIKLTAGGTMIINANISANGNDATNEDGGGGSGGSIYLICDTLAGLAILSSDGGEPQEANAGGGGGGRIALDYSTYNATLTFSVDGGGTSYPGAEGTVYPDANPTISTQDATSIQMTSATGNGSVDSLGINSITEHGHWWATSTMASNTPISHWKMNDNLDSTTVIDSVGENNGTASQDTFAMATSSGKINNALVFDGSNRIVIDDNDELTFANALSISVWIYIDSLSWSDRTAIVTKYNHSTNQRGYVLGLGKNGDSDKSSLCFTVSQTGSTFTGKVVCGTTQLQSKQWYHVAAIFEANHVEIYLNTDEEIDDTDSAIADFIYNNSEPLYIAYHVSEGTYFNGIIDDVRVYDYVLTSNEISQIYNSGVGTEYSDAFSNYSELGAKSSTGAFQSPLTDLIMDTTYYIRSYATLSDSSTIYGNEVQFDTPLPPKYHVEGKVKMEGSVKFK